MGRQSLLDTEMDNTSDDFETLYESNAPLIYRFMFWRTKDEMLSEDLTSSVFEKAWRTRGNFNGGSAKAWLFRIARTTLIDHWRKHKEVPDDGVVIAEAESGALELGESLERRMSIERLQNAVTKLPDEMRKVVELRFTKGQSVREVAHALDISESNVRVIQYRALQKLRKLLQ